METRLGRLAHQPPDEDVQVNLGILASSKTLFADGDGDGYRDRIGFNLAVAPGMRHGGIWAALINLAVRANLESSGAPLAPIGITRRDAAGQLRVTPPAARHLRAAVLERLDGGGWRLSGHSGEAMARLLDSLAMAAIPDEQEAARRLVLRRSAGGVCELTPFYGASRHLPLCIATNPPGPPSHPPADLDLLNVSDHLFGADSAEPRASRLGLGIELPTEIAVSAAVALADLVATAARHATDLTLPIAAAEFCPPRGLALRVAQNQNRRAEMRWIPDQGLLAAGAAKPLARLLVELKRLWFQGQGSGSQEIRAWKTRLVDAAGIAAGTNPMGSLAHRLAANRPLAPLTGLKWRLAAKACRRLGRPEPGKVPPSRTIRRRMGWQDETRRLLSQARRIPDSTGRISCEAFLSKPAATRDRFADDLTAILTTKGYTPRVTVYNAYKPGLSWLLGEVAAAFPPDASVVKISCRPFTEPNQLELSSRWIQELYPAPDLLAKRFGWDAKMVELTLAPGQPDAYRILASDGHGRPVFERRLTPLVSRLPYAMDGRGDRFVHPTCAGIVVLQGDATIFRCHIPTDREWFWRQFQTRWLPEMEKRMLAALPGLRKQPMPIFWDEVRLEIGINETQEPLGFDEERIAPMEALHEDLYFGLLNFVHAFGRRHCPGLEPSMGRIVPLVRSACKGPPFAKLTLKPMRTPGASMTPPPRLSTLAYRQGMLEAKLPGGRQPLSKDGQKILCRVAEAWGIRLSNADNGLIYRARPPKKRSRPPSSAFTAPDLATIPSGDRIREWITGTANSAVLQTWRVGKTTQGREVQVIEARCCPAMTARRTRLLKPTLLVNARHHANEISGSNAAMHLAWQLGATAQGMACLRQLNVVIIPLENADGVATFEELLPSAPDHKLHAARYNALGLEWYAHYHRNHSPIPEARVKKRLFERWLPAYMLDLHGVPSHEWEQPFAGYLNPKFREHWIPRSFVYVILPFLDRPAHPGAGEACELARKFSRAWDADGEIVELNRRIHDRYRRYAVAFEPDLFPDPCAESPLAFPTGERIGPTNYGSRRWPLVKTEVITEVLDEVASGPWLETCCRAHLAVVWSMIKHMSSENLATLGRTAMPEGVRFKWGRMPLANQD